MKTIELDFDDVTHVDDFDAKTPVVVPKLCECGSVVEFASNEALSGVAIADWPCVAAGHWNYCKTYGRIIYFVRNAETL